MCVQLDEKVAEKVGKVANSLGFTMDEMVNQILTWYFDDCEKENNM